VLAPYDAELFGHWWYEGPEWLDRVLDRVADSEALDATDWGTPDFQVTPNQHTCQCGPSSWRPVRRGWDRAATRHDLGLSGCDLDAVWELRITVSRFDGSRPDYLHVLGVDYARTGFADSVRSVWHVLER
jgi:hypothetical protein